MILRTPIAAGLLALVAFAACSSDDPEPARPVSPADAGAEPLPEPIAPGLYPLAGSDPDLDANDLDRLDAIVAGAAIVGIGESVHTTAAQLHLRIRLLRRLVERGGLRAIAFESSWRGIADVTEPYVTTCSGAPEAAAKRLHPVWWDASVPRFLEWLCRWNQAHPAEVVHVFGFDIRQPWLDAPAHRAYVGPAKAALADGLSACLGVGFADEAAFFADPDVLAYYEGTEAVPEEGHAQCQAGVKAALEDLETNRAAYVASSSEETWDLARLAVTQVGAFDETVYLLSRVRSLADLGKANQARDPAMTDAFRTIRRHRFPGLKTALWAHNGHVMRDARSVADSQWTGVQSLGTSLGEEHGEAYVVIGQASWDTTVRFQPWLDEARLPRPTARSLEAALESYGVDALLLTLPASPSTIPSGELEVGVDPVALVPAAHFDAFTWLRTSPAIAYFADPRE
ncbi:MAG: erythromycin esterase family protein [Labilithrix sp.]|nr:erythromycin esterase family protein [Labilithrix sp.]MCW5832068.1 erythromycin esterase family protein [Labilithrix sp.]